jgi:hypothetical protein
LRRDDTNLAENALFRVGVTRSGIHAGLEETLRPPACRQDQQYLLIPVSIRFTGNCSAELFAPNSGDETHLVSMGGL